MTDCDEGPSHSLDVFYRIGIVNNPSILLKIEFI